MWKFFLALGIVLAGVLFGIFIIDKSEKRTPRKSVLNPAPVPAYKTGTNTMVWIPQETFLMGSDDGPENERPVHEVSVSGFWMDKTEVTNEMFEQFVRATGYQTGAEKEGGHVFQPVEVTSFNDHTVWWKKTPGANWRQPEGPGSTIRGRENHPVVQVTWEDAAAYARWAGRRLPTEAEWEYATRGGLKQQLFTWGQVSRPGGRWMANLWQGNFPLQNTGQDGFVRSSPTASYPPNNFGLFDMAGNAWEWCSDNYDPAYYKNSPRENPKGPETIDSAATGLEKIQRGGSFLCSDLYSTGYRPGARGKAPMNSSYAHAGFRCVRDK